MTAYEPVIGLEVHAQMRSRTKLFCGCPTDYGAPPNAHTCPVCLALPGALPVPNAKAIELAVQAGLALECDVASHSVFARKNYFYPDLPKGYQISQFELPLNGKGHLDIEVDGETKRIGITRIHVEEDAAKNIHGAGSSAVTLVDFNRGGTPLVEIVSDPDLRSAAEAEAYLRKLRDVLMFIGVNDGNLEEGSFRCDANVSIRPVGQEELGTRAELKNINSFRFVNKAIEHEIARQEGVLQNGGTVVQETRTWNEGQGKTVSMRVAVTEERIEELRAALPELPAAKRARWQNELGLTEYDAGVLSGHPELAKYFEEATRLFIEQSGKKGKDAGKKVGNFVQAEVLRHVTTDGLEALFPVAPIAVAELLVCVEDGTINGKIAKKVFGSMVETGRPPKVIIDEQGLAQVTDTGAIEEEVRRVLDASPSQVAQYKEGKTNVIGYFVGQVMKATKGAANPKAVNEILRRLLDEQ
ncbi:MAG: Asp-tRNA(Asn)/Glu-tRNA(Gln) amidotransferase subunit GatB [Deltaproteobacteria bacterium]|nr:Asp-tRNA(Asn)/Glu-tRNA(Gln) amidotransferase subunit GatB [Deltaproteobacteria bacterium]